MLFVQASSFPKDDDDDGDDDGGARGDHGREQRLEDLGFDADLTRFLEETLDSTDPIAPSAALLPIGAPPTKRRHSPDKGPPERRVMARREQDETGGEEGGPVRERGLALGETPLVIERVHQPVEILATLGVRQAMTPEPFMAAVIHAIKVLESKHMSAEEEDVEAALEVYQGRLTPVVATFQKLASDVLDPRRTLLDFDREFVSGISLTVAASDVGMLEVAVADAYSKILVHLAMYTVAELVGHISISKRGKLEIHAWNHLVMAYLIARPRAASSTDVREHMLMVAWVVMFYGFLESFVKCGSLRYHTTSDVLWKTIKRRTRFDPIPVRYMLTQLVWLFATANHVGFTPLAHPPTRLRAYHTTGEDGGLLDNARAMQLAEGMGWMDTYASVIEMLHDTYEDPPNSFFVKMVTIGTDTSYENAEAVTPAAYRGTQAERVYREGYQARRQAHYSLWRRSRQVIMRSVRQYMIEMGDHMPTTDSSYYFRVIVDRWAALVEDAWGVEAGGSGPQSAVDRLRDVRIHAWHVATQIVRTVSGTIWMRKDDQRHLKDRGEFIVQPYGELETPLDLVDIPVATMLAIWLADPLGDMDDALSRVFQGTASGPELEPRGLFELNLAQARARGLSAREIAEDPHALRGGRPSVEVMVQGRERLGVLLAEIGRLGDELRAGGGGRQPDELRAEIEAKGRARRLLEGLLEFHDSFEALSARGAQIDEERRALREEWRGAEARGDDGRPYQRRMRALLAEKTEVDRGTDALSALFSSDDDLAAALRGIKDAARPLVRFGSREHSFGVQTFFTAIAEVLRQMRADAQSELSATGPLAPPRYRLVAHPKLVQDVYERSLEPVHGDGTRVLIATRYNPPLALSELELVLPFASIHLLALGRITHVPPVFYYRLEGGENPVKRTLHRSFTYTHSGTSTRTSLYAVHKSLVNGQQQQPPLERVPVGEKINMRVALFYDILAYRSGHDYADFYKHFVVGYHATLAAVFHYVLRLGWEHPRAEGLPPPERGQDRWFKAAIPPVAVIEYKNRPLVIAWAAAVLELLDMATLGYPSNIDVVAAVRVLGRGSKGVASLGKGAHTRWVMEQLGRRALISKFKLLQQHNLRGEYGWFDRWWAAETSTEREGGSERVRYPNTPLYRGMGRRLLGSAAVTPQDEEGMKVSRGGERWDDHQRQMKEFVVLWNTSKISKQLQTLAVDLLYHLKQENEGNPDRRLAQNWWKIYPYATRRPPEDVAMSAMVDRLQAALTEVYPVAGGSPPPEARFLAEAVAPLWIYETPLGAHGALRANLWHSEMTRVRFLTHLADTDLSWEAIEERYLDPEAPQYRIRPPGMGYRHLAIVALLALIHEEFLEDTDVRRFDHAAVMERYARYFVDPLELEVAERRAQSPQAMETKDTTTTDTTTTDTTTTDTTTTDTETPMELS